MKLTAYVLDGHRVDIRPAPATRDWMDESTDRFAYRCLPLSIANAHGWEILALSGFEAVWNGGPGLDAVVIAPDPGTQAPAVSHFGGGTLTFHVPCLFRTEPGYDLFVQGPVNRPKDAIAALGGIVETDWAPYTFTMNWLFTRPGARVRFDAGEPFCHIFPVKRGELEAFAPDMKKLSDEPGLQRQLELWRQGRGAFIEGLKQSGAAAREAWQRFYFRGLDPEGREVPEAEHQTRLRLKPFKGGGTGRK